MRKHTPQNNHSQSLSSKKPSAMRNSGQLRCTLSNSGRIPASEFTSPGATAGKPTGSWQNTRLSASNSEYLHTRTDPLKMVSEYEGEGEVLHSLTIDEFVADEQGMSEPNDSPLRNNYRPTANKSVNHSGYTAGVIRSNAASDGKRTKSRLDKFVGPNGAPIHVLSGSHQSS